MSGSAEKLDATIGQFAGVELLLAVSGGRAPRAGSIVAANSFARGFSMEGLFGTLVMGIVNGIGQGVGSSVTSSVMDSVQGVAQGNTSTHIGECEQQRSNHEKLRKEAEESLVQCIGNLSAINESCAEKVGTILNSAIAVGMGLLPVLFNPVGGAAARALLSSLFGVATGASTALLANRNGALSACMDQVIKEAQIPADCDSTQKTPPSPPQVSEPTAEIPAALCPAGGSQVAAPQVLPPAVPQSQTVPAVEQAPPLVSPAVTSPAVAPPGGTSSASPREECAPPQVDPPYKVEKPCTESPSTPEVSEKPSQISSSEDCSAIRKECLETSKEGHNNLEKIVNPSSLGSITPQQGGVDLLGAWKDCISTVEKQIQGNIQGAIDFFSSPPLTPMAPESPMTSDCITQDSPDALTPTLPTSPAQTPITSPTSESVSLGGTQNPQIVISIENNQIGAHQIREVIPAGIQETPSPDCETQSEYELKTEVEPETEPPAAQEEPAQEECPPVPATDNSVPEECSEKPSEEEKCSGDTIQTQVEETQPVPEQSETEQSEIDKAGGFDKRGHPSIPEGVDLKIPDSTAESVPPVETAPPAETVPNVETTQHAGGAPQEETFPHGETDVQAPPLAEVGSQSDSKAPEATGTPPRIAEEVAPDSADEGADQEWSPQIWTSINLSESVEIRSGVGDFSPQETGIAV